MDCPIPILYQDPRILVCLKPPGVVSTDQPGGLPDQLRAQLGGGPELCLRTVHRLDQRVGGVMVLAPLPDGRPSALTAGGGAHVL